MARRLNSKIEMRVWRLGVLALAMAAVGQDCLAAEPAPTAGLDFERYVNSVEARLRDQHRTDVGFLAPVATAARLRQGELVVEQLHTPDLSREGAMLHHWRGMAFAPGATVADIER